jgi:hypothetical protein
MITETDRKSRAWTTGRFLLAVLFALLVAARALPTDASPLRAAQAQARLHFEGYLLAQGPDKWLIADYSVFVDNNTVLLEQRGPAKIGAWVIVSATYLGTGGIHADVIEVERPAGQPGPAVQFAGVLNKQAEGTWSVAGTLFEISPDTRILGDPVSDDLVKVTAEQRGAVLWALEIEMVAKATDKVPVEFEGIIEQMDQDRWTISGSVVIITPDTEIIGTPAVGKGVEVRANVAADGALLARLIRVLDEPAEVTLGALVAAIVPAATGGPAARWDLIVFPAKLGADPLSAEARVDGNTLVDESRAVARPGQWVEIQALPVGAGRYQADQIRVEQPVPVRLTGRVDRLSEGTAGAGWWQVTGRPVWVGERVLAASTFQAGSMVSVEGVLLGNGVIWVEQW